MLEQKMYILHNMRQEPMATGDQKTNTANSEFRKIFTETYEALTAIWNRDDADKTKKIAIVSERLQLQNTRIALLSSIADNIPEIMWVKQSFFLISYESRCLDNILCHEKNCQKASLNTCNISSCHKQVCIPQLVEVAEEDDTEDYQAWLQCLLREDIYDRKTDEELLPRLERELSYKDWVENTTKAEYPG